MLTLLHILPAARFSVALPTPLAFVGFFNVVRAVANRFAFRGGKVFSFYSFNLFGICPLYIYIYMVVLDCCFLWLQEWRSLGVHETYVDFRREKENRIRVSKQSNKGEGKRPWKTQSNWGSGPTAMRRNTLSTAVRQLNF